MIPGGLDGGSVHYAVESVTEVVGDVAVAVVDQSYVDSAGRPRASSARHTHTYVVALTEAGCWICAGQNTARHDEA